MNNQEDPYKILGIERTANEEEIKKAYRKLAIKHHPDKNPDNQVEAEAEFKKITGAYAILSDPVKKKNYDLGIPTNLSDAFGGNFDPFSIFNTFFQGQNIDSFINDFFSGQSNNAFAGSFDDILGGPDIKFTIHSFTKMPGMDRLGDINFFDILKRTEDGMRKNMRGGFSSHKVEMDKKVEDLEKMNEKLLNRIDLLKKYKKSKKYENIEKKLSVPVEDIVEGRAKKIKIVSYTKKESEKDFEEEEVKFLFNLDKDLTKMVYIFPKEGHIHYAYEEPGDLVIRLNIYNSVIRYNYLKEVIIVPVSYDKMRKKMKKMKDKKVVLKMGNYSLKVVDWVGEDRLVIFKSVVLILTEKVEKFYKNWELMEGEEGEDFVEIREMSENWGYLFNFL